MLVYQLVKRRPRVSPLKLEQHTPQHTSTVLYLTFPPVQVFYKAPITTPLGGGYKSLNVTIRKSLGLFANVRPCVSYHPHVPSAHPLMNMVIVRENEEDLYAGIEHRQTDEVYQCLKLITQPGSERVVRYAFEYAVANGRKKVTCFSKNNIMKLTDGVFEETFQEVAKEYPQIKSDHMIVDIGTAKVAVNPGAFDVLVLPNLYGDIISDVAAEITGSVGLAGSANIGEHGAMFEAIHGSAPMIAGLGVANPSGLILGGVQMLTHVGQPDIAELVHNAWLTTIEQGKTTADIQAGTTRTTGAPLKTDQFADAVIANLGSKPQVMKPVDYTSNNNSKPLHIPPFKRRAPAKKDMVGVDVFLHCAKRTPDELAEALNKATESCGSGLRLNMLTNRGVKVWPAGIPETFCTDHWRARFLPVGNTGSDYPNSASHEDMLKLLATVNDFGLDFIKIETLCTFDGKPGFSLGQGQ